MTQLELVLWLNPFGRMYHKRYREQNKPRRNAQRMKSKWGGNFRDYLRGCV